MWNVIPRLLQASALASLSLLAMALVTVGRPLPLLPIIHADSHQVTVLPTIAASIGASTEAVIDNAAAAATCGDVVINEVLFNGADEWVELYTLNPLDATTIFKVSDLDSGAYKFELEVTLTDPIPADRHIVIHGNDEQDAEEPHAAFAQFFNAGDGQDLGNAGGTVVLSINGDICEEVHWGTVAAPESAAPVTLSFGTTSSIPVGESIQRNPSGTGTDFLRGNDPVFFAPSTLGRNNNSGTLPVTLAWFAAMPEHDAVHVQWQTATEIGNAGFHLLAATPGGLVQLNDALIPSTVIDSVEPVLYAVHVQTDATEFFLQEVALDGGTADHGPFVLGEPSGTKIGADWIAQPASYTIYLPLVFD